MALFGEIRSANAWRQRQQQNNPNYNASWMPKEGWRGRFNQRQAAPGYVKPAYNPETEKTAPLPPGYQHPYAPPPPPPRPLGFRTLAPAGVPAGGWGGGALEYETAPAPATPSLPPFEVPTPTHDPRYFGRRPNAMMEY